MAKILLVEDDEELRYTMRLKLAALGHTVDEAPDGKAGLERFQASAPDLVITDLVMPRMEGVEMIHTMKRARPAVKIVAMSGGGVNAASAYLRIAQQLGAAAILAKPFSHLELESVVTAALGEPPAAPLVFLVLDDDEASRYLNRSQLETEFPRSTVIECGSVREALDASAGRHLDAVITDHHLGESDGSEFVQRLRAQGADCPVLMVTGSSDPKVHARAYAAGATKVFFGSDLEFTGYLKDTLRKP
jgi:CheY-like chemotaxis protein